jgi:hypothetical protein
VSPHGRVREELLYLKAIDEDRARRASGLPSLPPWKERVGANGRAPRAWPMRFSVRDVIDDRG